MWRRSPGIHRTNTKVGARRVGASKSQRGVAAVPCGEEDTVKETTAVTVSALPDDYPAADAVHLDALAASTDSLGDSMEIGGKFR